jgi:hypothetical protein
MANGGTTQGVPVSGRRGRQGGNCQTHYSETRPGMCLFGVHVPTHDAPWTWGTPQARNTSAHVRQTAGQASDVREGGCPAFLLPGWYVAAQVDRLWETA